MKICIRCKVEKDDFLFSSRKDRPGKLHSYCKNCYSKYNTIQARKGRAERAYAKLKADPDLMKKVRDRQRELWISNRSAYLYTHAKARAKKKGMEFDIDKSDVIIPEICPILGILLTKNKMIKNDWYAPTIDRIDNTKGYIKGNIMIISRKANMMKNNATLEELISFCRYYINKDIGIENEI